MPFEYKSPEYNPPEYNPTKCASKCLSVQGGAYIPDFSGTS